MAIDEKTVRRLLDYLEGEVKILERSQVSQEKFDQDMVFTDATEHRVQIAVEMVINTAEHIVAGLKLGKPEYASDLFPLLAKEGIISEDLAKILIKAVGLRNILVHQYRDVDLKILTQSATNGLNDLRDFAKAIKDFLEKHN